MQIITGIILDTADLLLNIIPRRLALGLGSYLGFLMFCIDKRHRRLAVSNICRALSVSPSSAARIARMSFRNFGMNVTEFLLHKDAKYTVYGMENMRSGGPNIFVLGHFGNWEILGREAVKRGVRITTVGRKIKNRAADRYIKKRRGSSGMEILDKKGSFGSLLSALRQGRSAALLIDQYAGRRGVFVDFFGIPTSTIHSPAILHLKTGCPVVPVFIIRDKQRHNIFIEPEISAVKTGNIKEDIKNITCLMVKPLERYIKRYPGQWWWVHRRWREYS